MDENELDAIVFAIEEKINYSEKNMDSAFSEIWENFHKGQIRAYSEVLRMLKRAKNNN